MLGTRCSQSRKFQRFHRFHRFHPRTTRGQFGVPAPLLGLSLVLEPKWCVGALVKTRAGFLRVLTRGNLRRLPIMYQYIPNLNAPIVALLRVRPRSLVDFKEHECRCHMLWETPTVSGMHRHWCFDKYRPLSCDRRCRWGGVVGVDFGMDYGV